MARSPAAGRPDTDHDAVGNNGGVRLNAATVRGGVIAAIVLVVFGAASATPWIVTLTLPRFDRTSRPQDVPQITAEPQQPTQRDEELAHTLQNAVAAAFVLLLLTLVAYGLYRLFRRLRAAWLPEDDQAGIDRLDDGDVPGEVLSVDIASLATAVARAHAHLAGAAEPGDAVIAAWVALEDEAELQGAGRDPAQTATEFTTVLLEHTPAPPDAVAALRGLYHRARFTSHPVTADDVLRARESLGRIAEALDAAVPAGPTGVGGPP
jgi:hypothetical protein